MAIECFIENAMARIGGTNECFKPFLVQQVMGPTSRGTAAGVHALNGHPVPLQPGHATYA